MSWAIEAIERAAMERARRTMREPPMMISYRGVPIQGYQLASLLMRLEKETGQTIETLVLEIEASSAVARAMTTGDGKLTKALKDSGW